VRGAACGASRARKPPLYLPRRLHRILALLALAAPPSRRIAHARRAHGAAPRRGASARGVSDEK
jgi:hypothetical protein